MSDESILFETLVVKPWGKIHRISDPFKLGDASVFNLIGKETFVERSHNAKFALSAGIKKLIADRDGEDSLKVELRNLDEKVWNCGSMEDLVDLLHEIKTTYQKIGISI